MVAWVPLWIAAMVRDGFFKGLAVGLFWVTIGWVFIGGSNSSRSSSSVHSCVCFAGRPGPQTGDVIVYGPGGNER